MSKRKSKGNKSKTHQSSILRQYDYKYNYKYNYTPPSFVVDCGKVLLYSYGGYCIFLCLGLLL